MRFLRLLPYLSPLLLAGCLSVRTPSSTFNGLYSTTTGIRLVPHPVAYKGFADDQVLRYGARGAACPWRSP